MIDMCLQANCSSMLLGGIVAGNSKLDELSQSNPRTTVSGYIEDRITSPYVNSHSGANFLLQPSKSNYRVPANLYLLPGDEHLEIQMARVAGLTQSGPHNSWQLVHSWISDLIIDVRTSWNRDEITAFIDCNPSFTLYTEMAMSASDRLIIPFSADGSSKRAVRSVLSLVDKQIPNVRDLVQKIE